MWVKAEGCLGDFAWLLSLTSRNSLDERRRGKEGWSCVGKAPDPGIKAMEEPVPAENPRMCVGVAARQKREKTIAYQISPECTSFATTNHCQQRCPCVTSSLYPFSYRYCLVCLVLLSALEKSLSLYGSDIISLKSAYTAIDANMVSFMFLRGTKSPWLDLEQKSKYPKE